MAGIMQAQAPDMAQEQGPAVDTADQEALSKVILAGMKLMYDPKTFPIFKAGMSKPGAVDDKLATQAAGLMKMLVERSNNMPRQVIAPAAAMLLVEMAKFMEEAGMQGPTEDELKSAIMKLLKIILRLFGTGGQAPQAEQAPAQPAMMEGA